MKKMKLRALEPRSDVQKEWQKQQSCAIAQWTGLEKFLFFFVFSCVENRALGEVRGLATVSTEGGDAVAARFGEARCAPAVFRRPYDCVV